ncbi:transient receptor potential cation channel subfamily M member 2-like [Macrobrachium rosenbergii]|uniref:transient receptor potential cation channel subfamily M member 2-like n=1 Tax=Macrobrachium rosenbergii TaxID=79674 RepID=UPI0034D6E2CF
MADPEIRYTKIDGLTWVRRKFRELWPRRSANSTQKSYLEFIKGFQRKECIKFVPESTDGDTSDICVCGLKQLEHVAFPEVRVSPPPVYFEGSRAVSAHVVPPGSSGSRTDPFLESYPKTRRDSFVEVSWNPQDHIKALPTDSYGTLSFDNESFDAIQPVHYLRLSDDSQIAYVKEGSEPEVLRLLKKYWSFLEPHWPNLVISITGDTLASGIDGFKREKLLSVLIKAVKSTNACLVTDGLDVGYTRLVGKVVSKAQFLHEIHGQTVPEIKCLGIVPYGRFRGGPVSFKNKGRILHLSESGTTDTPGLPGLDRNHTHLFLVDNGFCHEKASADNFRSRLLNDIQEKPPMGFGIPVVVLLLEGGFLAIKQCQMALRRQNPVMVVEGTGRGADLLAYAASRYSLPMKVEGKVSVRQNHTEEQLQDIRDRVSQFLPDLDEERCQECAQAVAECCEMGKLITVFNINADTGMEKSILRALLTGRSKLLGQLELALQWDRVDVAEELIFPLLQSSGANLTQLNNIMTKAILDEKKAFIEFLLQAGVVMSQYLTVPVLRELYREVEPDSHLRELLQKTGEADIYLCDVHALLDRLVGNHKNKLYENDGQDVWEKEACFELSLFLLLSQDPYLEPRTRSTFSFLWIPTWSPELSPLSPFSGSLPGARNSLHFLLSQDPYLEPGTLSTFSFSRIPTWNPKLSPLSPFPGSLPGTPNSLHFLLFQDPYLELLLFAVLSRRGELALYLWNKCKNPLSAAIVATCLYQSLADSLRVEETNLRKAYLSMKDAFEKQAVELLDVCFEEDRTKSLQLVEQVCPRWGNLHLMDLALIARDMRLISSVCCQESVTERWKKIKWKFQVRQLFRVLVMLLHFYLVLVHLVYSPSMLELLLCALVLSDAIEKAFEAIFSKTLKLWFSAWTFFDLFSQVVFVAGFAFRLRPETFYIGKILYSCCSMLFSFRLFRVYYISSRLGPLILIFIFMIPKLLEFLAFLLVLLLGYGITSKALMYHPCNTRKSFQNFDSVTEFLEDIIFNPYWVIFGELMLDELQSHSYNVCQKLTWDWSWATSCETCDPRDAAVLNCKCVSSTQAERIATKLMLAVYLVVGNVLLLNLIIAIFTNVFQYVLEKSSEHWKFEMYRLIREYETRPGIPPPWSLYSYFRILKKKFMPWEKSSVNPSRDDEDEERDEERSRASLRIFVQNNAQVEPPKPQPSPEIVEVFERLTRLEENISNTLNNMERAFVQQAPVERKEPEVTLSVPFEKTYEKLLNLPEKINLLEEHLRSSQTRLEIAQAQHRQDIRNLQELVKKLVPSSPSGKQAYRHYRPKALVYLLIQEEELVVYL